MRDAKSASPGKKKKQQNFSPCLHSEWRIRELVMLKCSNNGAPFTVQFYGAPEINNNNICCQIPAALAPHFFIIAHISQCILTAPMYYSVNKQGGKQHLKRILLTLLQMKIPKHNIYTNFLPVSVGEVFFF